MDVLESGELTKKKITREYDLLNRSINYLNHCGTHKCSSHCLKITSMNVLYNLMKHKYVKDTDILTESFIPYAKIKFSECRMNYVKARIFDSFGENNLTRYIPIRLFSKILCDSNSQPHYHCRKCIQEYL